MGLHDREYMHEARSVGVVDWVGSQSTTVKLILLNCAVFLLWQIGPAQGFLTQHFMVSSQHLAAGHVWTLLTYAFSHLGFWHLFWNMAFLYWFGRDLEVIYGGRNLVALYLLSALGAAVAQLSLGTVWAGRSVPMLGASGSVMGIVVVTALFYPHRRIYIWGILPVPLWLLAGLYVLSDATGALSSLQGGSTGIAHGAHLGGAAVGAAFKLLDLRPFSAHRAEAAALGAGLLTRLRRRLSVGARAVPLDDRPRPAPAPTPAPDPPDAAFTDQVDEVLRKINRSGLDSLTEEERTLLLKASQRYSRPR